MRDDIVRRPSDVLRIEVARSDSHVVVHLLGDLDSSSAPSVREVLVDHADAGYDAVVDLSEVTFIDSSGVGVLVGALRRFQALHRRLALRDPTKPIRRVLDMTGLSAAFTIESRG